MGQDRSRGIDGPGAGVWTGQEQGYGLAWGRGIDGPGQEQGYRRARSRGIDGPEAGV